MQEIAKHIFSSYNIHIPCGK